MKSEASLPSVLLAALLSVLCAQAASAGSATWNLNPTSGDWNTASNWTPATVPNDPSDTASFDVSNTTSIKFSADTDLAAVVFDPGASSYTIATAFDLTLGGAGIVNNSGVTQHFVALGNVGKIHFRNSATAGDAHFTTRGFTGVITEISFYDTASAANGTFENLGGILPGATLFFDSSTAGNAMIFSHAGSPNGGACVFMGHSNAGTATFVCEGQGSGNTGVQFRAHSRADRGTFIIEGENYIDFLDQTRAVRATVIANGGNGRGAPGGIIGFYGVSNAQNATLVANSGSNGGQGGTIYLSEDSRGGRERVELSPGALLSIDFHVAPGVGVGSIEGDGRVTLGANNLTVGDNNRDTTFSGTIEDGTPSGGSLTKVGTGGLALSGANTYTGGTIVSGGTLSVQNMAGSATGSGDVSIQAGRLSGDGTIAGTVTVGDGDALTATISPGRDPLTPGTLTVQSNVAANSDAIYQFNLQSNAGTAAAMSANGVTIDNDALFVLHDSGDSALSPGTFFIVIANTAATPISGTFSNLADGATVTVGSNTFQANYEGGDGNDLTLTVVP